MGSLTDWSADSRASVGTRNLSNREFTARSQNAPETVQLHLIPRLPQDDGSISVTDGDIRRDVRKRGTNERLWWCRFRVETRAEATTHWTFIRPAFQDWEEEEEREGILETDAECKAEVAHLCWNSEMKLRMSIAIDRTVKFILFVTALYLFLVLIQACLPELGRCGKICRIYCVLPSQNSFTSYTKHV